MAAELVVVRRDDLVVLGVRWSGLQVVAGAGVGSDDGPPMLEAVTDDAHIELTFPPQHIAEESVRTGQPFGSVVAGPSIPDGATVALARLAGSSRIGVAIARGTRVELSAAGLLAAARGRIVATGHPSTSPTAIEIPWGLVVAPESRDGGPVTCEHPAKPITSASGAVGIWHTSLRANAAGASPSSPGSAAAGGLDAGLALRPLQVRDDQPGLERTPLDQLARQRIAVESQTRLPRAERLVLSSLGGSLSARGAWDTLEWDHDIAMGRDQRVRLLWRGRVYPFGHRGAYVEVTERAIEPDAGSSTGEPLAALRTHRTLIITEPVVPAVADDDRLRRSFPFDEVEITTTVFSDLGEPDPRTFFQPTPGLAEREAQLTSLTQERERLRAIVDTEANRVRGVDELAQAGFFPATELQRLESEIGGLLEAIGAGETALDALNALQDRLDDINREIGDLSGQPFGPDGFPDPSVQAALDELNQQAQVISDEMRGIVVPDLGALHAARRAKEAEAAARLAEADQEGRRVRSVDELVQAGLAEAQPFLDLAGPIDAMTTEVVALREVGLTEHELWFVPRTGDNRRLLFPVRFGAGGDDRSRDVLVDLPLVFVHDLVLPEVPGAPAFVALTDPEVARALDELWKAAQSGRVDLAGKSIDLVRATEQQPGDVHEVHQLDLVGVAHGGGFRPRLAGLTVTLPALRQLLPERAENLAQALVPLQFGEEFLDRGEAEQVALRVVEDLGSDLAGRIDVDFTAAADRCGALVSPKFAADAISRLHGPVNAEGLLSLAGDQVDLDPRKLFEEGASILGFDLRDLVKELKLPPSITADVAAGGGPPVVTMRWEGVRLQTHKPFEARDNTTLDLTVVSSPERNTVTCTVKDFALVLPPVAAELLRLTFRSVTFTQEAGQAPKLDVDGLAAEFLGPLDLLNELQKRVDLGSAAPAVEVTSSGISARYALAVPDAKAGAFQLSNIDLHAAVEVPFDTTKRPISVSLGFASRAKPFNVSVMAFGGGGYVDLQIDHTGLRRLEASIEFGASLAVDFVVASGEVHAFGGVQYVQTDAGIALSGFIRFGGSVEVLGLLSVSVELRVALSYDSVENKLFGQATLVIEIDLTLYSDSVEIDSGTWELIGGDAPTEVSETSVLGVTDDLGEPQLLAAGVRPGAGAGDIDPGLAAWQDYRRRFNTS